MNRFEKNFIEILEKLFKSYRQKFSSKKIGIFVSGGIDSSIIAYFTNKYFKNITLFTLTTKGAYDFPFVKLLNQKLKQKLVTVNFNKKLILTIKNLIIKSLKENKIETNFTQISLGCAFYFLCQQAKNEKIEIVFSGQGPDVLLAGYHRYLNFPLEKLNQKIKNDLFLLEKDKTRDQAIANFFNLQLVNPYLEREFVNFAVNVPPHLKINQINNQIFEKYLSRKVGERLGLPKEIIFRHKKAIQYSTKLENLLRKC